MKWIDRLAANQINYWGGFVLDVVAGSALAIAGAVAAGPGRAAVAVLAGLCAYTFYEYAFHRWLYHHAEGTVSRLHRIHHTDRSARLGAPFFFSLSVCAITWGLASLVVDGGTAAVFAATVLVLYAFQSAVHHIAHGWAGTRRLGGALVMRWRRHHLIHHRDGDVNYGIITSAWDHVFGTAHARRPLTASSVPVPAARPSGPAPP